MTPGNIGAVRMAMGRSPLRSTRKNPATLNLNRTNVCRILRCDLKFHPYKTLLVQELIPTDHVVIILLLSPYVHYFYKLELFVLRRLMAYNLFLVFVQ